MAECGKHEPVGRRIQYLYGVFSHGHEEQALREWEQDHAGANKLPRHDYKPEHLDVGARMFALHGCPDRAREIMEELFQLYPTWNSSIAKAVFRAHTKSASVGHHDLAEGIYKGHKQRSSKEMTLQDYDAYFVGFLEARHLPNAMAVFHDMVRQGRLATSLYPAEIEKVLARLHKLYRLGKDIVEINDIGLEAIELLPEAYHSHVYGHWMRAALGSSAPEASVEVLQFMVNRDFHPQTVHCNLFLKVLFRTKDTPHVLKAEDLGWRMIENARKAPIGKLPHAPASELISQWPKWIHERQMLMSNKEIAGKLPSANVTTFALMMRHHAAKLQWEHVDYLARQLKESGLHSNTEIMNILMDNKCRQGKFSEVWEIYRSLTDGPEGSPGVFPDGASIRCLWKTLRLALGDFATRDDPDLPRPRELLAETVQWWTRCRSRPDAERFRMGLAGPDHGALSSLMLHCFSYSKDLAGSLVSLHILRKHFLIFPSDTVAEVLQKHAAWVDLQRSTPQERSHFNRTGAHQQTLDKLGRIYYILEEQRKQRTGIAEEDYNRLSDEEIGDIGLNLLSEFVRVVMKRSYPPEEVEVMINQAKDEAGVPEMSTGDMDAFQVA
ncbi:hypothetical protein BU23DRAFT_579044 [Bimuria novae-zelandiae CBS 107.79]|uniref:Pentatricopeptide repeat protein n=1 Tax=Bimuria novae-zelandiae CBS 107.79 TaxID=1447943 RepID=A0A6A5VRG7_9PLEO|nr:hypothetical protein BU23DRAFT_579044 [Bimuria novae-zelandiae CBS 107.79]